MAQNGDIDNRLAKALDHPLRVRVIEALGRVERASPAQIAETLGISIPRLAYHFKVLARDCEVIVAVDERQVRGTIEHFYSLKPDYRVRIVQHLLAGLRRTISGATEIGLEAEAMPAALAMRTVAAIEARAKQRLASGSAEATTVVVGATAFSAAPSKGDRH